MSDWRFLAAGVAGTLLAVALAGCESTQDQAKRLHRNGSDAFKHRGLSVTRANPQVKVLHAQILHDQNGTAVVAELRNTSKRPLLHVPLAVTITAANGRPVYRNDVAGVEKPTVEASLLMPGRVFTWVNDQISVDAGPGGRVSVVPGVAPAPVGPAPDITVSAPTLSVDPTSGPEARGRVINKSKVFQTRLAVFVVARKGSAVVAAGTGVATKVPPNGGRGAYAAFFIGNPMGAAVTAEAPPVNP